jgi:hypothetical protein
MNERLRFRERRSEIVKIAQLSQNSPIAAFACISLNRCILTPYGQKPQRADCRVDTSDEQT